MSMARPAKGYYDKDAFEGKRNAYRPMEVIVVNTGPYPIEWETRNRHTAGIHRNYHISANGGKLEDEYADFIVLKFGDFRVEQGSQDWPGMMRRVSSQNKGGCIPFVEIWSKNEKGKKDKLLWDGKEQFKAWLNSEHGQRHLLGGKSVPIPVRIKRMKRDELIELSIKAHFPLDCIKDDIKTWPNVRIMRVLATKCSPEYLEDVLGMSFDDIESEDEGDNDGATLSESGTKGSGQSK